MIPDSGMMLQNESDTPRCAVRASGPMGILAVEVGGGEGKINSSKMDLGMSEFRRETDGDSFTSAEREGNS